VLSFDRTTSYNKHLADMTEKHGMGRFCGDRWRNATTSYNSQIMQQALIVIFQALNVILQEIIFFRKQAKKEDIQLGVFFFHAKRSDFKAFGISIRFGGFK